MRSETVSSLRKWMIPKTHVHIQADSDPSSSNWPLQILAPISGFCCWSQELRGLATPPIAGWESGWCYYSQVWKERGFPGGISDKEPAYLLRKRFKRFRFNPWIGKIPWRRAWQLTLVFLPGESHGQRNLGGLQSTGSQRVGHNWGDLAPTHEKRTIPLTPRPLPGHIFCQ